MVVTEHLRPGQLEAELVKVEERRDPPVPVEVFLLDGWHPGVLHGWSRNPRGVDGLWGLCVGLRAYSPGYAAEFCTWLTAESIRQR